MTPALRWCVLWQLVAILASVLVLGACGFAPRGSISGGTGLGAIYVDAPRDVAIAPLLREELRNRNLVLADNRDRANILVRLTNESLEQRILSVQSTGRVSEYELRHSVDMLVAEGRDGAIARYDPEQLPNTVSVLREYTYDETGVLGKADEAAILREEMRQELARQLLLRLVATTRGSAAG